MLQIRGRRPRQTRITSYNVCYTKLLRAQGNPLLDGAVPNLIVTPHVAWASREARQRIIEEVALNIEAFLAGEQRNFV